MKKRTKIQVRSRSTAPLSRAHFTFLENSPLFARLVEGGIVSLVRSRKTPHGVRAGPYVGSAIIDNDIELEVAEKEAGTLSGLLQWALPEGLRSPEVSSSAGEASNILTIFALGFVDSVSDYLQNGVLRRYRPLNTISQRPRGRIDVRATISLRARGRVPDIASVSHELTSDILPNRLLAYGLERATRLLRTSPHKEYVLVASQYTDLFSHFERLGADEFSYEMKTAVYEQGVAEAEGSKSLTRALKLAQPFIFDGGLGESDQAFILPQAYFLNLELLFEVATRHALQAAIASSPFVILKGGKLKRKMFGVSSAGFVADPDIVVLSDQKPIMTADCKYKTLANGPDHQDVYQVTSHATAIEGKFSALLYPGKEYSCTLIGKTRNDVRLWTVTLRPSKLGDDLRLFASELIAVNNK